MARGGGARRDSAIAASWYRRSEERGDFVGQLNFGDIYGRGAGVTPDRVEACFWLILAAAQDNAWSANRKKEIAATMMAVEIAAVQSRYEALKRQPPSP